MRHVQNDDLMRARTVAGSRLVFPDGPICMVRAIDELFADETEEPEIQTVVLTIRPSPGNCLQTCLSNQIVGLRNAACLRQCKTAQTRQQRDKVASQIGQGN